MEKQSTHPTQSTAGGQAGRYRFLPERLALLGDMRLPDNPFECFWLEHLLRGDKPSGDDGNHIWEWIRTKRPGHESVMQRLQAAFPSLAVAACIKRIDDCKVLHPKVSMDLTVDIACVKEVDLKSRLAGHSIRQLTYVFTRAAPLDTAHELLSTLVDIPGIGHLSLVVEGHDGDAESVEHQHALIIDAIASTKLPFKFIKLSLPLNNGIQGPAMQANMCRLLSKVGLEEIVVNLADDHDGAPIVDCVVQVKTGGHAPGLKAVSLGTAFEFKCAAKGPDARELFIKMLSQLAAPALQLEHFAVSPIIGDGLSLKRLTNDQVVQIFLPNETLLYCGLVEGFDQFGSCLLQACLDRNHLWRKGPRRNAAAARLVERGSRFLDSAGQPREFPADVQTNLAGKIQEVADETPSSYQDFALTCKFVALGIDNAGKGLAPTCKSIDFVFWRAIHLHLTWDLSYTSVRVAVQSSLRALKAELESAPARGEPAIAPAVVLWTLGRAMLDGVIAEFTGEHPELATLHGPPDDPSATPVKLWLAEAQHVAGDPGGAGILDADDEFALRPGRWLTGSDRLIQPLCTYLQAQSALLPGISTTREIVEDFCRDALARLLEEWFCECMRLTFPLPGGLIAWQLQHETATRATGKLNEPAQVTNEINRRGH